MVSSISRISASSSSLFISNDIMSCEQRFNANVMERIMGCSGPAEVEAVLRVYRFKTLRLVRSFFDDIGVRLEARRLIKPYAAQLKVLRGALKTDDGDFAFVPPLRYPHQVCTSDKNSRLNGNFKAIRK